MTLPKILIVEDQKAALGLIDQALSKVMPKFYPDFQLERCNLAKCYKDARNRIEENVYGLIILDHRIPINHPGNLEQTDFDAFSDSLQNIGYSLIPEIKKKNSSTIVIGTSSLSQSELTRFPKPDYQIRKSFGDIEEDLENILTNMKGGNE